MVWSLLFFARAVSVGCNIHVCVRRTEVSADDDLIVWSYGHNGFDWIGLTGTERTKGKRYCAAEFDIAVSQREWMGIYTHGFVFGRWFYCAVHCPVSPTPMTVHGVMDGDAVGNIVPAVKSQPVGYPAFAIALCLSLPFLSAFPFLSPPSSLFFPFPLLLGAR